MPNMTSMVNSEQYGHIACVEKKSETLINLLHFRLLWHWLNYLVSTASSENSFHTN